QRDLQRWAQRAAYAGGDRFSSGAAYGRELLTGDHIDHACGLDHAVDGGGDRDRIVRQPVYEVHGPVDRVHDPGHRGRAGDAAAFLAQDRVIGPGSADGGTDQLLGGAVDLGDRVGIAGFR